MAARATGRHIVVFGFGVRLVADVVPRLANHVHLVVDDALGVSSLEVVVGSLRAGHPCDAHEVVGMLGAACPYGDRSQAHQRRRRFGVGVGVFMRGHVVRSARR